MEDGGGAVLEPKDLSGMGKCDDEVYIQLNCDSRGRVRNEKRLFEAEYVFDCVRRNRLLPNLSEYLCKQKECVSRDGIKEGQMEGTGDPFEVSFSFFSKV